MERKHKYDVYVDEEIYREDIEADSEEDAIEEAQDQFYIEQENSEDGEDIEIDLDDYKFKAVKKS